MCNVPSNDEFIASRKVADEANIGLHRAKLKSHPNIDELMDEMKLIQSAAPIFAQQTSPNIIIDYVAEKAFFNKAR